MAKIRTLQLYRGTTAQNDAYTGSVGELTMDTTTNELRLHDGSTAGGHIIGSGGGGSGYHPDLFSVKWSDHQINDIQWLRGDTFSWQDGSVYQAAYQHLADDIDGKTLQSETVAGTTIQFYLADDGHKICPESEESNVMAIYNATGVAWYYIIDTVNERFKLPRTQYGFTGLRDTVEKYVEAELPNITATFGWNKGTEGAYATGAVSVSTSSNTSSAHVNATVATAKTDFAISASDSNSIYQNGATVQPPATQMYLYFYVGSFTQTAIENTAGLNAELFNGKADVSALDTKTAHVVTEFQEPTSANGYTWYRKYADGWVEQGGYTLITDAGMTINLLIEMANTNYDLIVFQERNADGTTVPGITAKTVTNFSTNAGGTANGTWEVKGMAA